MKAILIFLFVTIVYSGVVIGPHCYQVCVTACCMLGASQFAKQAGCVYDIQGCGAMCMPICAAARFIPTVCFAEETTFNNGTILIKELAYANPEEILFIPGDWTFISINLLN